MEPSVSSERLALLKQTTAQLLKACTRKLKTARVPFASLLEFVARAVELHRDAQPSLQVFGPDVRGSLLQALEALADSGQCQLERASGETVSVEFPGYYTERVREAYREAETVPDASLPSEATLGLQIPNHLVTTVGVSTDLPALVQGPDPPTPIVRLLFPESLTSVVVPTEAIRGSLLDVALAKLRHYLSQGGNAAYVQSRLAAAYGGNLPVVNDMVTNIAQRPAVARQTIESASDAYIRFWGQLTHLLAQERAAETEPASGNSPHQAAHVINAYAVAYRSAGRDRERAVREALKRIEAQLGQPPFVYSLKELYGLKDSSGAPVLRKDMQEAFVAFLKERLRPASGKAVAELIRLKAGSGGEYFVHRERIVPALLAMIPDVAREVQRAMLEAWKAALLEGRRPAAMSSDTLFASEVQRRMQHARPLFARLLDEALLVAVQREVRLAPRVALALSKCFDRTGERLRPAAEILGLERRAVVEAVRAAVPWWRRLAPVRFLIRLVRVWLGRRRAAQPAGSPARAREGTRRVTPAAVEASAEASPERATPAAGATVKRLEGAPTSSAGARGSARPATLPQRRAAYRRELEALRDHFAGPGESLAASLDQLAEKWNPLFDPQARQELREDVDATVRSFLRGILRGARRMKPPDADRIAALAERLAANRAFDRIRRRDLFTRYVELAMIRELASHHGVRL